MTLGDGIFYASLVISVTALFIATKDRWNWKKILLWPIAIVAVIAAFVYGSMLYDSLADMKPRVQDAFWGITLNTSKSDIKFMKGEPTKIEDNAWTYRTDDKYTNDWSEYYIRFRDGKIRYVWYMGSKTYYGQDLQGIGINDSSKEIFSKFGKPTDISLSDDQLQRAYSYENYHVFFVLAQDQVIAYGIINPAFGPLKHESEYNAGK